jgi:hypothetical protein
MPIKKQDLIKYTSNKVFVETGSYCGDGIQLAIDCGFNNIHSIELSEKHFKHCINRFKDNSNIKIHRGDSSKVLFGVIENINENITFWLDGHYSCGDTALGDKICPLLEELELIKNHHIKTHTILIDDMRCWLIDNPKIQFGDEEIRNKILEINKDYTFLYEDGECENDILVAIIK